jgi:putative transposase
LLRLVTYIHQNPQKHEFTEDFRDWPHTSFHTFLLSHPTRIQKEEVLTWFGGEQGFREFHRQFLKQEEIELLVPED